MDQEFKQEFETLTKIVKSGFDTIDEKFVVLETKMATKEDLKGLATKDDLKEMEERLNSKIAAVQSELEDIREKLNTLSLRTKDDDDSVVKDIFALRRRVDELETKLKQIQLNQN